MSDDAKPPTKTKPTDRRKRRYDATLETPVLVRPTVDEIIAEIEAEMASPIPERESEPPPRWVQTAADSAQEWLDSLDEDGLEKDEPDDFDPDDFDLDDLEDLDLDHEGDDL
jgi:hypothetical protein